MSLFFGLQQALALLLLFEAANRVGRLFPKAQEVGAQLVPQGEAGLLVKVFGKFKGEGTMAGAGDVLAELFLVRRENMNAAPPREVVTYPASLIAARQSNLTSSTFNGHSKIR